MNPLFEHFISTYLGPLCSLVGLLVMGMLAVTTLRMEVKLAQLKEEIMNAVNGKYLHSKVAEAKFDAISDKFDTVSSQLEVLGDRFTDMAMHEGRAQRR